MAAAAAAVRISGGRNALLTHSILARQSGQRSHLLRERRIMTLEVYLENVSEWFLNLLFCALPAGSNVSAWKEHRVDHIVSADDTGERFGHPFFD